VAGKPRRRPADAAGPYPAAVLAAKPSAYWRLREMAGREAHDASPHGHPARYEDGVAFYLEGPAGTGFDAGQTARAAHFAGGRVTGSLPGIASAYTFEAWFWNGLPANARPVTGWLFAEGTANAGGDMLGIGGSASAAGKLLFANGSTAAPLCGSRTIQPKTWNHVAVVREAGKVAVYLNGNPCAEILAEAVPRLVCDGLVFIGGRSDGVAGLEGKMAEAALYGRALAADEIARHYAAAGVQS